METIAKAPPRILLVCRDASLRDRVGRLAGEAGVDWERSVDRVIASFERTTYDLMIVTSTASEAEEAESNGLEILEVIARRCPVTQILFLVEREHLDVAVAATQLGTFQYARLPISDEELGLLIENALTGRPRIGTNLLLKSEVPGPAEIVGASPAMEEVYRQIVLAAGTDIPVLVTGETGTGKDLVARAIHDRSTRADGPFVAVNVGAVPPELVGSELFGHEKGAFTGAADQRAGRFESGDGGSVFLDEIGTIDEKVQVSLLRLIETKRFQRLGGQRTIEADIRLIAATNEDLAACVEAGTFREDLYYRLDVYRIHVPPLRDRAGDVRLLSEHFVGVYAQQFDKALTSIDPAYHRALESYAWPGNVRELKNVVQRSVLVCEGDVLSPEHLPPRLTNVQPEATTVSVPLGATLADAERLMIIQTLQLCGNNRKRTAEVLGISRRSLYNKLKRHDIP